VAIVAPAQGAAPAAAASVRHCLEVLATRGFARAITAALAAPEVEGFLGAGFVVRERLHLLTHDLKDLPDVSVLAVAQRRARRRDRPDALEVDAKAFPPFWRLDDAGLDEALAATPSSRFRLATAPAVIGYAVSGRAARRGYLQRLAVDPDQQRQGIGTALVVDGLRWMRRWGVTQAVVNTQEDNRAALTLYERLGFRRQASGLAVLEAPLG
jgi:ribosomal protein S18 acetylase RimI-like enzyme